MIIEASRWVGGLTWQETRIVHIRTSHPPPWNGCLNQIGLGIYLNQPYHNRYIHVVMSHGI